MYCIARQGVLPARSREQAEVLLSEAALHSLAELFEAVPDPRGAHGLGYDLPFLLTCLDEPLALDGKTVREARSGAQAAPHRLSFCTHHSQETLWQVRVNEKTNEIPVAQAALPTLPIRHRVCIADATTHRHWVLRY